LNTPTKIQSEQGQRQRIIVGVGDIQVTDDRGVELITYALGSCIGVTVYDPVAGVGGLLHFMLPNASIDKIKAAVKPAMFGDTGIPLLFKSCYKLGAVKERLVVCAAGGAEIMDDNSRFRIGPRNRTIIRKIFWKNSVLLSAEDSGGTLSRTMSMQMDSGQVSVTHKGEKKILWPE